MDNPTDLTGLTEAQARQYLIAHGATLILTEKRLAELDADLEKWRKRVLLAADKQAADLAAAAETEVSRLIVQREKLAAEAAELRGLIDRIRGQLPGVAARQRSVDPDLLEQELLIATGRLPGDEAKADVDRRLAKLEQSAGATDALAALKAKMGFAPAATPAATSPAAPESTPAEPAPATESVPASESAPVVESAPVAEPQTAADVPSADALATDAPSADAPVSETTPENAVKP